MIASEMMLKVDAGWAVKSFCCVDRIDGSYSKAMRD
jgi:hypothetical protein